VLTEVFDMLLSLGMSSCVVALIYQYMPARRLVWRAVFCGALVTSLLIHVGRWAIGLHLGMAVQPSALGATASFVALLLWLCYSVQIFQFGAGFTSLPQRLARSAAATEYGE
jgi:membrane protein